MRRALWLCALFIPLLLPHLSFAATVSFNPIISGTDACTCAGSAPDWGCVLETFQNAMNVAVALGTVLITVFIAWAGIGYLMAPVSAEARTKGRQRIINAVLGLLIMLCAWLLIDSLMKVIYAGNSTSNPSGFLPWNSVLSSSSGSDCIRQQSATGAAPALGGSTNSNGGATSNGGTVTPVSTAGAGACNASNVQSAAANEGVQISSTDANTLACLAKYESACGTINQNYKWGQGSSAYGAFQVTLSGNAQYYNNAACETAAGVSGPLNCQNGFSGGNPIPGSAVAAECEKAAANLGCNAAAAAALYDAKGISQWTADPNSTNQGSCG